MHAYLIRYGMMRNVGQFSSDTGGLERGQTVVIRSHRGTELGEVLWEVPRGSDAPLAVGSAAVVRSAEHGDREAGHRLMEERHGRFAACARILDDGPWPIELIDVEPLLDEGRTVLHYFGPHNLDVTGLRAIFREQCGLDVVFEPAGRDVIDEPDGSQLAEAGCGHGCGSCGTDGGGCATSAGGHGSCGDCGVKKLLAQRRVAAAP
jgi:hypothetical protein